MLWLRRRARDAGNGDTAAKLGVAGIAGAGGAAGVAAAVPASAAPLWQLGLFFLKTGAVLYGSGYVLIAFLEGGYDLGALGEASVATIDGLTGRIADPVWPTEVQGSAAKVVDLAVEEIGRHSKIR